MIVQENPDGGSYFIMTMAQHTAFADRLAEAFGNASFAPITNAAVRYIIAHHDAGWLDVDAAVHINPTTQLPYHLSETPFEYTSVTMRGSPEFNVRQDALAGLLSSMHTVGLLNGRYGLAPPGILARFEGEKKVFAEGVLADELTRQEHLKTEIKVDSDFVWTAYKQLQFFDMLSLYFHCKPMGRRHGEIFPDVPTKDGEDVTITLTERNDSIYALDPFPFATDGVQVMFEGRWLEPIEKGIDGRAIFEATPVSQQIITLVSA
jgi:hypothetical protein